MKRLLPMLVGLFISFAFFGTSQQKTHFDNKPHVEGEMLVKILSGTSLKLPVPLFLYDRVFSAISHS